MEHQLSQGDCSEEHKEEVKEKLTILVDGGCENQRESTDGCSKLYVVDIYIIFENVSAIQIFHEHKYAYLVASNEETRSTSPSPVELQEVDQVKKKEEEEVPQQEPLFL